MDMATRRQIQFEIETAKMRYDWAVAERERTGGTPALEKFIVESGSELAALAEKLAKTRSTRL